MRELRDFAELFTVCVAASFFLAGGVIEHDVGQ